MEQRSIIKLLGAAVVAATAVLGVDALANEASATNHALLIGISDYADERITDLEGPEFDVAALREVLIEDWEYPSANIATLLNEQASEQGILAALDRLAEDSRPGDSLLIYFSGHGTSAQDISLGAQLHLPDGSGALVAYDFDPERFGPGRKIESHAHDDGLLIGRYDLRPRFEALDKDRTVLVMFDACFTGNTARGLRGQYTPATKRFISLPAQSSSSSRGGDTAAGRSRTDCDDCATNLVSNYPYKNVVYYGASAEHELAVDISQAEIDAGLASSFDGKPHGAFTDAVLRALASTDRSSVELSYRTLFQKILREFKTHCVNCGHTPVMLPSAVLADLAVVNAAVFPGLEINPRLALNAPDNAVLNIDAATDVNDDLTGTVLLASADTIAFAPWLTELTTRQIGELGRTGASVTEGSVAPIVLTNKQGVLEARAADGQLISTLAGSREETLHWVSARTALQERIANDRNTTSVFPVEIAHPLHGAEFHFGEKLTFSTRVNQNSHLLVLVMDAAGDLHRLYPVTREEWSTVIPAGETVTLPATGSPELRVTAPAGTDEMLFYALPEHHPMWATQTWASFDATVIDFAWLHHVLAQTPSGISSTHRRLIAVAPE